MGWIDFRGAPRPAPGLGRSRRSRRASSTLPALLALLAAAGALAVSGRMGNPRTTLPEGQVEPSAPMAAGAPAAPAAERQAAAMAAGNVAAGAGAAASGLEAPRRPSAAAIATRRTLEFSL